MSQRPADTFFVWCGKHQINPNFAGRFLNRSAKYDGNKQAVVSFHELYLLGD